MPKYRKQGTENGKVYHTKALSDRPHRRPCVTEELSKG